VNGWSPSLPFPRPSCLDSSTRLRASFPLRRHLSFLFCILCSFRGPGASKFLFVVLLFRWFSQGQDGLVPFCFVTRAPHLCSTPKFSSLFSGDFLRGHPLFLSARRPLLGDLPPITPASHRKGRDPPLYFSSSNLAARREWVLLFLLRVELPSVSSNTSALDPIHGQKLSH